MNKQAFSLTELMVGLLVSMFLVAAIAGFMGKVGYTFQEHKAVMKDRGMLQKAMASMSRDLMFIGQDADESGQFDNDGTDTWFLDLENNGDENLGTSLTYYQVYEDMDYAASSQGDREYSWLPITYTVETDFTDPVSKEKTNILRRNGEPFLLGVTQFKIALGTDSDADGVISDEEWITETPEDAPTKASVFSQILAVKVTIAQETHAANDQRNTNTLVREIYLRNRRVS